MSSRSKKRLKAARKEAAARLGISYISRNDPCPCGSGKKTKVCCLNKIKQLKALPAAVREQLMVARILGPGQVPAAVAEQFAAIQAQTEPVAVEQVVAEPRAEIAASVTIPIVSGTIQVGAGAPIEFSGGTLTVNPQ